jgi:recombination protein RecT
MSDLNEVILSTKENFERISDINFPKEAEFAMQTLSANSFLMTIALKNPLSLKSAIVNLSACNLSLNPVLKLAYLVPRGGKVCLDISYMGLMKLATDSGSIVFVQAAVVRRADEFSLNGFGQAPTHKHDPFSVDRGDIVGAYAIAKLATGEYLTEVMSIDAILDIRDRTEAYKSVVAGKTSSCPWTTDLEEMLKKTVIRRASKSWPKTERLANAFNVLSEYEGINFDRNTIDVTPPKENQVELLIAKLKENNKTEDALLKHLADKYKRPLAKLDELTGEMVTYSINLLTKKVEATA